MRLLIRGGRLITLDDDHRILEADLAVVGDRIAGLGTAGELIRQHGEPGDILDASGQYVIPGLVNAHTHTFEAAFRGLGDGLPLREWLRRLMQPAYRHLSAEDAYWFTLVGCVENVRSGVTTAVNFQSYPNDFHACQLTARAFGEVGLRGLLVKALDATSGPETVRKDGAAVLADTERVFSELHDTWQGRVRFCVGPPNLHSAPGEWVREAHAVAARHGSGVHTHIVGTPEWATAAAEQVGTRQISYFASLGVLDERFQAANCVDITLEEIHLLAQHGAHVMHRPVSDMYLAHGAADIPSMVAAGVNVALATDGPASNNNQNMFAVMKTASLLQKVTHRDASLLPPGQVLEMATRNGAKAAYMEAGALEVGLLADLAVVDLSAAHNQPLHRPVSALVYSAHADDVQSLVVGGQVVMRDRQLPGVNEREIIAEATWRVKGLLERSGQAQDLRPRWPWC